MKMTENIDEHISAFEQERGKIANPKVVELIKAMAAAGDQFEDLGERDARSGRGQRTKEAFIERVMELADPEEKDNPIVDLMYQCYLDGFEAGTKRGQTREEAEKTEAPV